VLDQALCLAAIRKTVSLSGQDVVRLLQSADSWLARLLLLVLKQSPLERLSGVEVYFLSHSGLLVLEHLLSCISDQS